jgi:hypothetical protein
LNLNYAFKHFSRIDDVDPSKPLVITDQYIPHLNNIKNKDLYMWIMEPPSILPWVYKLAYQNKDRFKFIFTHNKNFHESVSNTKWYPWGSYYIPLNEHQIYNKSKNVSIVASSKMFTEGHKMRHDVIKSYKHLIQDIKQGDPVEPKIKWHRDHRYSIAIENHSIRGYFTEKIIDCFRTGTIPIYRGDSEILNYFDPNGIILFKNTEDLESILLKCDEEAENYLYPWKYIKENYL